MEIKPSQRKEVYNYIVGSVVRFLDTHYPANTPDLAAHKLEPPQCTSLALERHDHPRLLSLAVRLVVS
eukprot:5435552-Pyramimonas_sp.AAC.2